MFAGSGPQSSVRCADTTPNVNAPCPREAGDFVAMVRAVEFGAFCIWKKKPRCNDGDAEQQRNRGSGGEQAVAHGDILPDGRRGWENVAANRREQKSAELAGQREDWTRSTKTLAQSFD